MAGGLKIERRFTEAGSDPYESIRWSTRDSRISNPDGSIVFEMLGAEIPADWSQVAADIMVSKYFRKAGVPQVDAAGNPMLDEVGNPVTGPEQSSKQVFSRLAETWRWWGETHGYFASGEDAQAFEDELKYMLATQMAAPNSPQWFNTGIFHAYGIKGPENGFWRADNETGEATLTGSSYEFPPPFACFIQSVDDDLVNEGGIMDLWVREARLFKFGSGTGTNFSAIRSEGERLSGGGTSSGVMSYLKVGDRAAGAIKSGGTTRRAAKMVVLDLDHPEVETFIEWKKVEEEKARILIQKGGFPADFNGEAYATVAGQNSNNSVRASNGFMQAVIDDGDWHLTNRTDGSVAKTVKARELWHRIADAAWACADPGIQFHTTINQWHTCSNDGDIRASNPCFTGDTRVATDKGLISFKSLVQRVADGEAFEVFSHDATNTNSPSESIRLSQPSQVMVTGTNEILRLTFSDGRQLRCTPNHRLWTVDRGWVRADELEMTDDVRLLDSPIEFGMASYAIPVATGARHYQRRSSRTNTVNLPEKWDVDFAHYLGWLVGDGSLTDSAAVTVYGSTDEQQSVMFQHRELLTAINGGVAPKPAEMVNGTFQLRLGRGAFRGFLSALGVKPVRSHEKRVPWSVFEAPKEIVGAFLQGLFDADGTVVSGDKSRYVGLGCASRELLRDVQLLLDTFGVHGSIYETRAPSESSLDYTSKAGDHREYSSRPMFDLRVTGQAIERFDAGIGFLSPHKRDRLAAMLIENTRYRTKYQARMVSRESDGWETTYNLTEPVNHSYLAQGMLVSNCSEYMFLDDTACNLASLNLVKFVDEFGEVDVTAYQHAIRLWTLVLEISVTMGQLPSKRIAERTWAYRTLGLGYANVGSLLMRRGLPYDSDEARSITGALTAILTGHSYATSAEIAAEIGPFPRYEANRESMLRVIENHRRAAYNVDQSEYDNLDGAVMGIDADHCPSDLVAAARASWDLALDRGRVHGYRNAQATVLAPTGTIGLLMDCDTTGVEPDFALVKFKKLSGGGYFKIINQSVSPALRNLGYSEDRIDDMITYVIGTSSLDGSPHINRESLRAKGFSDDDLVRVEATLAGVFELKYAFSPFVLGGERMEALGFSADEYSDFEFDLLRALGFAKEQIEEASRVVCGMQTIEGAPHLADDHLAVFDCANRNGKYGRRFIHHSGHIRMMAAAQSFISGAISKTINMPNEVSVEDVAEAYKMSWELGLKAMALYRDGSKASQPLSSGSDDSESLDEETVEAVVEAVEEDKSIAWGKIPVGFSPTQAYLQGMMSRRFHLPARRAGWTQEARVGGHKIFLRTGEYEDGTLGELFIDLAKEGATLRGVLGCFAMAVSKGLQYGVPLEEYVDTFTFQTFEPRGMVEGHSHIKMANSIVDYVFRALGVEYLHRDELAQVPPDRSVGDLPEPPEGEAWQTGKQLNLDEATMEDEIDVQVKAAAFVDSPTSTYQPAPSPARAMATAGVSAAEATTRAAQAALGDMMGDAPLCDTCGHITVRNGSCYKCLNCGNSLGCS